MSRTATDDGKSTIVVLIGESRTAACFHAGIMSALDAPIGDITFVSSGASVVTAVLAQAAWEETSDSMVFRKRLRKLCADVLSADDMEGTLEEVLHDTKVDAGHHNVILRREGQSWIELELDPGVKLLDIARMALPHLNWSTASRNQRGSIRQSIADTVIIQSHRRPDIAVHLSILWSGGRNSEFEGPFEDLFDFPSLVLYPHTVNKTTNPRIFSADHHVRMEKAIEVNHATDSQSLLMATQATEWGAHVATRKRALFGTVFQHRPYTSRVSHTTENAEDARPSTETRQVIDMRIAHARFKNKPRRVFTTQDTFNSLSTYQQAVGLLPFECSDAEQKQTVVQPHTAKSWCICSRFFDGEGERTKWEHEADKEDTLDDDLDDEPGSIEFHAPWNMFNAEELSSVPGPCDVSDAAHMRKRIV